MELFNLMTLKDLAKALKKSESTVRTWKRRGVIPKTCFKELGGSIFVKIKETQAFLGA